MDHKVVVTVPLSIEKGFIRNLHGRAVYFEDFKRTETVAVFEFNLQEHSKDVLMAIRETLDDAKALEIPLDHIDLSIEFA